MSQEKGLLFSQYYSPEQYNAAFQNWVIAKDNRGVFYFGNSGCLLEYDGNEFREINVPNNSAVRAISIDSDNQIFIGAYEEIGVLVPNDTGILAYQSLTHLIDSNYINFGDVWESQIINDDVYFLTDNYIFRFKNNQFDYWKKTHERFYLSFKLDNEFYVQEIGNGLLKLVEDSLVLIEHGDFFANKRIHSILDLETKLLVCTRTQGLFLYDKNSASITPFTQLSTKAKSLNNYFLQNTFYHGIKINNNLFALSSIEGAVLLVNSEWNVVDVIDERTTGIVSSAQYLYYEEGQALWMALSNGICRVDILSPFRFWNDDIGINGAISDVASLDDYFYISTLSGVYCMHKNNGLQDFTVNTFKEVEGKFEQSWGFLYFIKPDINFENTYHKLMNRDKYFHPSSEQLKLLTSTSTGIHEITENRSKQISDYRGIFDIYQYKKDPTKLFLSLSNGIALLDYNNGQWTDMGMPFGIIDKIKEITEDSEGNLWANAIYKGIYKIENPLSNDFKITFYDTQDGLPSENIVTISEYNNKLLFSTYTEDLAYVEDADSFVLFTFPQENGDSTIQNVDTLCWYKFFDTRLSPLYVTTYADSMQWFGTSKGIFRYSVKLLKDYYHLKPPLIRKVLSGDSLIFGGTNYKITQREDNSLFKSKIITNQIIDLDHILEFKDNSLTFHYTLPYYDNEDQNEYSFFLEGNDETWSPWTKETKKEYTNLREGDYIFKVKAKTQYQIESPVTEFRFTVLAPWYRTFAAVLGYIVLGIVLIIVIVRLYTYRLIKEKDKLEKIVIERTQEILMQKEEILVQAEHLKEANERISAKNEELEKQKWEITNQALKLKKANVELIKLSKVASETDNAIAIFDKDGNMEWVNDGFTRLYGYTFDEYSKEKNINLLEGSDNPNIREAIKSCLKNKQSIVYEFKTTNKQGEEIWAQTTLTHVVDKDNETINLIAIDSDITKLKQAEQEILKQKEEIEKHRDELAKSNATKNKFFRIIAHDLRNPISTLAGSTNLIFNDFDEYNKEQTKSFIGELNRLSQTTFNLLENLLDWSSSQMGELKFEPKKINLDLLTQENIELIKQKVDSKNIKLVNGITHNYEAFADENMVKTIIRNLLSNAVKFTPDKGEITIRCSIDGEFLKYSVKDSGIGINKEDLKKLFKIEKHHTTPGLSNEKGSGLGLILCKEFVERNGGEIQISSEPNKGTTIEFTLQRHSS